MAVFHHLYSKISRGTHTCAVATAAYRSGSRMTLRAKNYGKDTYEEYVFDFSRKPGIGYSAIIAPKEIEGKVYDRQVLWQNVEDADISFDADLAREFTLSLPEELSTDQNIDLIKEFVSTSFIKRGFIADVNYHNDHLNNHHLHILCPLRQIKIANGSTLLFLSPHPLFSCQETLKKIQQEQVELINKHLSLNGYSERISITADKIPRYSKMRPWL